MSGPTPGTASGRPTTPALGEPERVLHGLTPEVRTVAHYLLVRTDRPVETPGAGVPDGVAVEVALAAQSAVRDAILDAAERGLEPSRVRALHTRLDRAFAVVASGLIDRAVGASRALVRDVSHDLRSPLNSILFLADALADERSGQLNDVQRRQVGVLYTAALSLVGWLNDILDASGLGQPDEIAFLDEPFSVESVLNQVDEMLRGLAAHAGVELAMRLETFGPRRGDRRVMSRILVNLVSNGIQATPRGGRVEVHASELRTGWLTLVVEDSGTDADIDEIRRRLTEASSLTPSSGGRGWTHGLGLSICARLAEAVDGQLTVEGGEGASCRFRLDLPFARTPQSVEPSP